MLNHLSLSFISRGLGRTLPAALVLLSTVSSVALASTAANTTITNTVLVDYKDAGGTAQAQVSATATVTVTLVASAPTLSSPGNTTINQSASAVLTYTITGTANGPDTYNLSTVATPTNVSAVTPTFSVPSVLLGGTTLSVAAANGNTSITTPYDGTNDSVVYGIAVGDVIVIGANQYTVSSVAETPASNSASIGLAAAISGGAVAIGQIVGERRTFTLTVPSGDVTTGSSGSHSVSSTATSVTAPAPATTQGTATVVTVNRPTLTVTKLVSTNNGTSYAASGTAAPGTSLIYKIVVTNGGSSNATEVAITDVVPEYLTYVAGSGKYATSNATAYASATALTEGSDGYSYTAGTFTVNYAPGSPGLGTIAGSGELVLFFRATINN
jgi:uncharacterized repeat protein (TIGR01451 family)